MGLALAASHKPMPGQPAPGPVTAKGGGKRPDQRAPLSQQPAGSPGLRISGAQSRRASLNGGRPAQGRVLGRHGRQTVRKLLEAGLAELAGKGYQALRVEDVVRRAQTSHGTFYLYFASKEDLLITLSRDALDDMRMIAGDFPVVTPDDTGRAALRRWVRRFCEVYATHATIIRILSQAEVVGEDVWADGMRVLFRLAEAITQGVAAGRGRQVPRTSGSGSPRQEELTALACLMMLERVNYLFTVGVQLSRAEMADRLSDIIFAAFQAPRRPAPAQRAGARHQVTAT